MTRSLAAPFAALCLLAPALSAQAVPSPTAAAVRAAAETITPEDVRRRISVIADDTMRGRATPSPELDQTAAWIASEFRRFGLRPGGEDGGYLQRYAIRRVTLDPPASTARFAGLDLRFGRDVAPAFPVPLPVGERTGPLVVVSGTRRLAAGLDGASLAGRHVLLVPPAGSDVRGSPTLDVVRALVAREPLAIWVASDRDDADWAARANAELRREHAQVGDPQVLAAVLVRDAVIAPALRAAGLDLAELRERGRDAVRVDDIGSVEVTLAAKMRVESEAFAPNVVGILPGSDPALADQYVVFSAHMDHVGIGAPDASGDTIYNGADDDASGTTTVVELAEAFASLRPRPRRSLIFLTVSGEERGLWGSEWFVAHPPVPTRSMVADLNVDMVGRNWTDTIVAIGREHSDLGETLARVGGLHPELGMTAIDDLWPEERFYMRSDHFNFARAGVPILFFFNGTHADYHRPSDEVERIDAEKTARIGRLLFYLGLEVANRAEAPRWNPDSYRAIVEGGAGGRR